MIGNSVTNVGDCAFFNCTSLTSVYFLGNAPTLHSNPFLSCSNINYYLSGMTGFGTNFGGMTTAIWGPKVAASVIQNGVTNTPNTYGNITLPSDATKVSTNGGTMGGNINLNGNTLSNGTASVTALQVTGGSPTNGAAFICTNTAGQGTWQPLVYAIYHKTGTITFASGNVVPITWDNTETNVGRSLIASNGYITNLPTGKFTLSTYINVGVQNSSDGYFSFWKNGTEVRYKQFPNVPAGPGETSFGLDCNFVNESTTNLYWTAFQYWGAGTHTNYQGATLWRSCLGIFQIP